MAPWVAGEILRPRRPSGAVVRPLNFTVRWRGAVSSRGRFAFLTFARLLLGVAALARAVELFKTESSPLSVLGAVALLLFGAALLWWGMVGVRALRGRNGAEDGRIIADAVADMDRRAPSGLRPLWIGLLLVVGIFLVWILYASFRAT